MIGLQQWICKVWGGLRWNHQLQNWCCNGFAVFVNRFRTGPSGCFFTCVLTPFASYFATHYGSRGEKNEHIYCISLGFPSCWGDPKWLVFRQAPKWDCLKSLRSRELHSTTSWFTKINLIDWIWLINIDQWPPLRFLRRPWKYEMTERPKTHPLYPSLPCGIKGDRGNGATDQTCHRLCFQLRDLELGLAVGKPVFGLVAPWPMDRLH